MQETQVWSRVREDPACCEATKPMCHDSWSPHVLEPMAQNKRCPRTAPREETLHTATREKPSQQWRPSTAKNKEIIQVLHSTWASPVPQMVKHLTTMQETQVRSLGQEDPLEKEMATHSSILAWKISWTRSLADCTVHGVTKSWTRLSD